MMSTIGYPKIVDQYISAYNRMDAMALADCVTDDIVFQNISNSSGTMTISGKQSFAELAQQAVTLFSERQMAVQNYVCAGDQVALEINWTGVPVSDFGGFKAGVAATLKGATFMTIADGKLQRIADLS